MFKKSSKFVFVFIALFSFIMTMYSQKIIESKGDLESLYLKWKTEDKAECYQVFYSGEGVVDKKVDNYLIRNYGSFYRVDIPGLKAGDYKVKIVPVINGSKGKSTESSVIHVIAQERIGFAFINNIVPGAYQADGTPKKDAVVIYVTENNKDTLSLNVKGATVNPCVGIQTILDGYKKGKELRPLIVRFVGMVNVPGYSQNGDLVIENKNNPQSYITMEGVGNDAMANGWGIRLKHATNVEIRNLGFINCFSDEGDNIGLQQDNEFVWVHNCDFFYGGAGEDADQVKGDGALDCKKSRYVTFSYNHFWDSGKSNLLGFKEDSTDGLFATYHHNWYDHSDSRHPRVRYYSAHILNNYFDGNSKYGVGSMLGASVFVEGNYFRNCKYPMEISMQGSDIFYGGSTFSNEDGGMIKAYNNFMTGEKRFLAYGNKDADNSTIEFDAYVANSRDEKLDTTIVSKQGHNAYNNFDTNKDVMYSYPVDAPEGARNKVVKYAGRVEGGDLKWVFNNEVDDESHDVNKGLKAAVKNYKTKLVFIQAEERLIAQ